MTHTSELKTLEERLTDSGWQLIEKEQEFVNYKGKILGDIDLLFYKENFSGRNYLYIEEKGGRKAHLGKAKKQIAKGMKHIINTYNPDRVFAFYCHKQKNELIEVYEK